MAMNFHDYPYTDLHEMNLDWCIAKVKELTEAWLQTRSDWEDTQQAWEDMKTYINNYFDNLNVQTEINNKIDALVADGTLSDLIAPYVASGLPAVVADQISAVVAAQIGDVVAAQISAVVAAQLPAVVATETAGQAAAWLETHVDPDTGYVIDDSLTIQGAAADAKATGDAVTELNNALTYFTIPTVNLFNVTKVKTGYIQSNGTIRTDSGGEYNEDYIEVSSDNTYAFNGTFSSSAHCLMIATYDSDKTFIERLLVYNTNNFTPSSGVSYVRLSATSTDTFPNQFMFVVGTSVPSSYIPCTRQLDIRQEEGTSQTALMSQKAITDFVENEIAEKAATVIPSVNLFNIDGTFVDGKYLKVDGYGTYSDADSCYTDYFIPIEGGEQYIWSKGNLETIGVLQLMICMYDANKASLGRITTYIQGDRYNTYTFGASVAFVRISFYQQEVPNDMMFVKGSKLPECFIPYGSKVPMNELPIMPYIYANSNILWFGDSISMLRELPHKVGRNINASVADASIAGAPFVYSSDADYNKVSVVSLMTDKIAGSLTDAYDAIDSLATRFSWSAESKQKRVDNLDNLSNADMSKINTLVILAGTNDFGNNVPIDTFKTGISTALGAFITEYPQLIAYVIAPPYRGDTSVNSIGKTLADYVEAEREVAESFGIPFYNLLTDGNINAENMSRFLNNDNLHPSEYGDDMLAIKCGKFLLSK